MTRAKKFSLTILFGLLLFSSSILAQEKGKIKSTTVTKIKSKKSKLDLIKTNPNYKIISKKNNHITMVTTKKKRESVIDALKAEFKR